MQTHSICIGEQMIKCLECGFETNRLQWTHFRYKCTGRFQNSQEYVKEYPGALLVDPALAKRTAVTESTLIKKYGKVEGTKRWNQYRQRQADVNSFEYKQKKYGWTKEQFDEYNKSRAVTLAGNIEKYGEEEGTKRWMNYCERQAYTNTLAYFVEKYGEKEGTKRYERVCSEKSHTAESVAARLGISLKDARLVLQSRQSVGFISEAERQFVLELEKYLGFSLKYSCLTTQYKVYSNNRLYVYDVVHGNRAIEFNGDYWHCNPKIYTEDFVNPTTQVLAKDAWAQDAEKIQVLLEEREIETLTVWDKDWQENKEETLKLCADWINDKR